MNRVLPPDYDHCIVNLACSVMKEFGLKPPNASLPECDRLFHGQKNVVLLLLDGMGDCILKNNLSPDGILQSHQTGVISSVFPPTTVAATTSLRSGLYPIEHSWLGWDCYFHQLDRNVSVFTNTFSETQIPAGAASVAGTYIPYQTIARQITLAGGDGRELHDFAMPRPQDLNAFFERLKAWCDEPGRKYIYAYIQEPDHTMHEYGCYGRSARRNLRRIERKVTAFCRNLKDTLVLITADHGHINIEKANIQDQKELADCLLRPPSLEPRALNFFVKKGREKEFEARFREAYGEQFRLWSREEIFGNEIFGKGIPHPQTQTMIGDYLALGTGRLAIFNNEEEMNRFKGHHTGLTAEEMEVPLIAVDC